MFKTLSFFHIVLYFLLGLVMSTFASDVLALVGLPLVYEALYLPILYFLRKDFTFLRPIGRQFMPMLFAWFFLLVIALLLANFSFIGILSVARSYLILSLFICIGLNIKMDKRFYTILFLVSFGSVVGWGASSLGKMMGILPMGVSLVNYGNMLSIPISIASVFSFFPNLFFVAIILILNFFLSFTTGLRRQILVSIVSFVLYYAVYSIRSFSIKTLVPVVLIVFAVIASFPIIEDKVAAVSPELYHRVFVRTLESGETGSDMSRQASISNLINNADAYILPRGFVSKRTAVDTGTGVFIDVPAYELCYTFGVPLVLLFYILMILRVIKIFLVYIRYKIPPLSIWFISGVVFILLVFVEGTMLSWTYTVPMTGLIIGAVMRYGNSKRMKEIFYYKD